MAEYKWCFAGVQEVTVNCPAMDGRAHLKIPGLNGAFLGLHLEAGMYPTINSRAPAINCWVTGDLGQIMVALSTMSTTRPSIVGAGYPWPGTFF